MKSSISCKSCLTRGESFQPKKDGVWVPQYTLRRQDTKNQVSDFHPIKLNSIRLSQPKVPPTTLLSKKQ